MTRPKDDGLISNICGSTSPPKLSQLMQVDPLIKDLFKARAKILSGSTNTTGSNIEGQSSPSSSSSSIIDDIFVFPKKIQFELPDVSMEVLAKHINALWSSKFDSVLMNNTRVLLVGATLGAAISTGVFIGVFSVGWMLSSPAPPAANPSSTLTSTSMSLFGRVSLSIRRRLFWYRNVVSATSVTAHNATSNTKNETITATIKRDVSRKEQSDEIIIQNETNSSPSISNSNINKNDNDNNVGVLNSHHVIIIQGNPTISTTENEATTTKSTPGNNSNRKRLNGTIVTAQYRSCLDSITASLKNQSLTWENVRNVSAKLVSTSSTINDDVGDDDGDDDDDDDDKHAKLFRTMLNGEYSHCPKKNNNTLVSISFVTRLEDINSKIQVEVLAS